MEKEWYVIIHIALFLYFLIRTIDILRLSYYIYYDSRSNDGRSITNRNRVSNMQEISSDVIRGYNDTIILFFLREEPSYGYEISRNIKTLSENKYLIKETTLYSAFTRLEKNGYITSFSKEAENGKRRTYYQITDSGRKYYREKCEEWQLTKDVIERFISEKN